MPGRRGEPTLLMLHGETPGRVFGLEGEAITIGRDPSCHIVLPRKFVSRRHARILVCGSSAKSMRSLVHAASRSSAGSPQVAALASMVAGMWTR